MQINPQTPCPYDSYETSRPKTLLAGAMPIWKIKTAAFSKQQLALETKRIQTSSLTSHAKTPGTARTSSGCMKQSPKMQASDILTARSSRSLAFYAAMLPALTVPLEKAHSPGLAALCRETRGCSWEGSGLAEECLILVLGQVVAVEALEEVDRLLLEVNVVEVAREDCLGKSEEPEGRLGRETIPPGAANRT